MIATANKELHKKLDAKSFNYGLFVSDLNKWCKCNRTSMSEISANKFYRSETFLSRLMSEHALTLQIAIPLCEMMSVKLSDYEIKQNTDEKCSEKRNVAETIADEGREWDGKIFVSKEFGVVSFNLLHNGEVFTRGLSRLDGETDKDVAKSISYAAHICYKNVEQAEFVNRIEKDDPESSHGMCAMGSEVSFKMYIRKFVGERTDRGELARYISANYSKFPSWGEKKMKTFFVCEHASSQVTNAFDSCFEEYRRWKNRK